MSNLEFRETGHRPRLFEGSKALTAPDPGASAARRLGGIPTPPERLFFLQSPVFPDGIDAFLDRLDDRSVVVLVEPEPSAVYPDPQGWERLRRRPQLFTLFGTAPEEAAETVESLIAKHRLRGVESVRMTAAARLHQEYHELLLRRARESLALTWQNRATTISFGRLWIRNLLLNLPGLAFTIDDAVDVANRPILVAGAGLSLEESAPLILRERARLTIVSVDTALPYLLGIGVTPDIVVSVDAQQLNVKDLLPPPPTGVRLFFDATAAPSFIRKFPKTLRFAFISHFAEGAIWNLLEEGGIDLPVVEAGGSVGTTALLLADRLRRAADKSDLPIFLSGLDFAFPPGKPHARGTYTHKLTLLSAHRLAPMPFLPSHLGRRWIESPGKNGGTIITDYVLAGYAARLRGAVDRFSQVYDLSNWGAAIGLPVVEEEEATALITSWEEGARLGGRFEATAPGRNGPPREPRLSRREIVSFLQQEAWALQKLTAAIRAGDSRRSEAFDLLRRHDYVTYFFPDPTPRYERSYLRRVVASAGFFVRYIQRALGRDEVGGNSGFPGGGA